MYLREFLNEKNFSFFLNKWVLLNELYIWFDSLEQVFMLMLGFRHTKMTAYWNLLERLAL